VNKPALKTENKKEAASFTFETASLLFYRGLGKELKIHAVPVLKVDEGPVEIALMN
jgi:hypothetical protein